MIFLRMLSDLPRKPEDLRCHLLVGRVFSGWGDVETKQHPDSVCKKKQPAGIPGFAAITKTSSHKKKSAVSFQWSFIYEPSKQTRTPADLLPKFQIGFGLG